MVAAGNGTAVALDAPRDGDLKALISRQSEGLALDQPFYRDERVYRRDLDRFLFREWLLVGHSSELPDVGSFLLFEMADESVIVVRGRDHQVRAFANVCRHRGSRVCLEQRGKTGRFVCPYHAWTYDLDGRLASARLMDTKLDPDEWGLKPVRCETFEGLIFVTFSDQAPGFDALRELVTPLVAPFDLSRTKVAFRECQTVRANWKLLIENYFECYHCGPAHPEFAQSHVIHMPDAMAAEHNAALAPRSLAAGIPTEEVDNTLEAISSDSPQFYCRRYALFDGYQTGSEDGKPVAPLLGHVKSYDGGASDLMVGVLNNVLIYCDHAVIYRFLPTGPDTSLAELIWLVRDDADLERDVDVDRMTWLWRVTTEADIRIVEANQSGINSMYYRPGPYAPMEIYTNWFVQHYLERIA